MQLAKEIKPFDIQTDNGENIELVLIQETGTRLYTAIDRSYYEQSIGPVISNYQNGTLVFPEGDDDSSTMPDVIKHQCEEPGEHLRFTTLVWRDEVANKGEIRGYWEWVSEKLRSDANGI